MNTKDLSGLVGDIEEALLNSAALELQTQMPGRAQMSGIDIKTEERFLIQDDAADEGDAEDISGSDGLAQPSVSKRKKKLKLAR